MINAETVARVHTHTHTLCLLNNKKVNNIIEINAKIVIKAY